MNFAQDIIMQDARVLLRPFSLTDLENLRTVVYDADIWRFTVTRITDEKELGAWVQAVQQGRVQNSRYTFMIVDKATGRLAGSTSYGNISAADKRLEIGWTWLSKDYRGTGLNRHCKFLLLHYAFDVLHFERVELKTDVLNIRSRRAMLKLGATEEGTLRSHTHMHDGRRRDTIYYSILRPEWEHIRQTIFSDLRVQ
ncbi:GNAT family N-acetyltransferase [Pontibacter sp. 172403-2]|uniref:GNAT family N-acetyltransferase n=1 Tax=Pontibacter rufus TaxID=2791028 RepID=UPI0018AFC5B3|nr:GNAT family protein [Pontibacter sp. 172403-2]MBF9252817.1 GNAT family N-acetyltransferase [Pontibacter sp. 172403-2]